MNNISVIPSNALGACTVCGLLDNRKVRKTDRSILLRKHSKRFVMPGLTETVSMNSDGEFVHGHDCFIPQGICVTKEYVLISAYDYKLKLNSVIYVCRLGDGECITTLVLPVMSHCGGLAYDTVNNCIWVCDEERMIGIDYTSLETNVELIKKSGGMCLYLEKCDYTFATDCVASFAGFSDGLVWVGEFNEFEPRYAYGYEIDAKNDTKKIIHKIPVPKKTQGIAFYKCDSNTILITSNSYRRTRYSRLCFYETDYNICKKIKSLIMLPMSEGIDVVGEELYIIFESGAIKYSSSKRSKKPTDMYYTFDVRKLLGK